MTDEPKIVRQSFEADFVEGATSVHPIAKDGQKAVKVRTPNARLLADMSGTLNDLVRTIGFLDAYLATYATAPRVMSDALWTAALVTYYRACDRNGLNAKVKLDLLDTIENAREAHKYFTDLRSKYVAHSVNALEQSQSLALLTDSDDVERQVVLVGVGHMSFNPLSDLGASELRRLALLFAEELQERVNAATDVVKDEVAAMDLDAVYALPAVNFDLPDIEAQRGSRKKE